MSEKAASFLPDIRSARTSSSGRRSRSGGRPRPRCCGSPCSSRSGRPPRRRAPWRECRPRTEGTCRRGRRKRHPAEALVEEHLRRTSAIPPASASKSLDSGATSASRRAREPLSRVPYASDSLPVEGSQDVFACSGRKSLIGNVLSAHRAMRIKRFRLQALALESRPAALSYREARGRSRRPRRSGSSRSRSGPSSSSRSAPRRSLR